MHALKPNRLETEKEGIIADKVSYALVNFSAGI